MNDEQTTPASEQAAAEANPETQPAEVLSEKEELLKLTRGELNDKAIEAGLNPEEVESATRKEVVVDMLLGLAQDGQEEGSEDEPEPEKSQDELNQEASEQAAAEAKAKKEADVEARKQKLKDELKAEKEKAEKEKAARNTGKTQEYVFINNLKCDGIFYEKGKRYKLPAGLAKVALDAGCIVDESAE